jgi:hypothetical protein
VLADATLDDVVQLDHAQYPTTIGYDERRGAGASHSIDQLADR